MFKSKQKKIESLNLQLLLVKSAISRYVLKASERIDLNDSFMVKYMNESNDFKNLLWRKNIIEIDLHNLR